MDAAGFQQNRAYWSPESFEHIDMLNGNLVLTFTDLALPGNVDAICGFSGRTLTWSYDWVPTGSALGPELHHAFPPVGPAWE